MRDTVIRLDVLEELHLEGGGAASGIQVSVRRGCVTLAGAVPSSAARCDAERAAWKVRGVLDVINELLMWPSAGRSDVHLARRATALIEPTGDPLRTLGVTVEGGWILLTGQVGSEAAKAGARKALGTLPGVAGIVNLLEVVAARPRAEGALAEG